MSEARCTVSRNRRYFRTKMLGAANVQKNYIHISSLSVRELGEYAEARGLTPSELLAGRFWIRREPSAHEGTVRMLPQRQKRSASASAGD